MKKNYLLKIYLSFISLCLWNLSAVAQDYDITTAAQCNNTAGGNEIVNFTGTTPNANGNGTLTVYFRGDFDGGTGGSEYMDVYGEGSGPILGTTTSSTTGISSTQCNVNYDSIVISIPMADINTWAADGTISFTADAASGVSASLCYSPAVAFCVYMRLEYPRASGSNDIGIASIDAPTVFCAGSQNIYVTVQNYGINQINNCTVNWTWNGVAQTPINVTQLIDTAQGLSPNYTQLMLGTKTITDADTLVVWTSNPNGGVDTININDTITKVLGPSLVGTYTINSAVATGGTNYQSFTDLVNDLTQYQICGPIIVNVAPGSGPYNEQISLPAAIGSDATNTITINGNGNTLTMSSPTSGNYATVNIDGADYITFNDLTIEALGTDGFGVHLMNGANNNSFHRCTINANPTGTGTTSGCVSMSGSATSYSTGGTNGSNNLFDSCSLSGGYFGFYFYSVTGAAGDSMNNITNCIIKDYYVYGSYNYYQHSGTISNNTFDRATRASVSTAYGVVITTGSENMLVEKNTIRNMFPGSNSGTGYLLYCSADGSLGRENKFFNNLVYNIGGNGTLYGMYLSGADYVQAYHNTIVLDDATATGGTTYGIYNTGTVGGIDIQNNIVYIARGGTGTKYCIYLTGAGAKTSNYNDLYMGSTTGTNAIGYNGSAQSSLAAWQAASGAGSPYDGNSLDIDPIFTNPAAGDFTPANAALDNMGTPLFAVVDDINGNPRDPSTPDIGAIEFTIPMCASTPDTGTLSGPTGVCAGTDFTLTASGLTIAVGISYDWQYNDGSGWQSTGYTSSASYTVTGGINVPTQYRVVTTCLNTSQSATSNVLSLSINSQLYCYCIPVSNCSNEGIQNVTFNTLNNSSNKCTNANGYEDFSSLGSLTSVYQGQTIPMSVTAWINSNPAGAGVWIDYDQNGVFDTYEFTLLGTFTGSFPSGGQAEVFTAPVTIDMNAVTGITRMRVRSANSTAATQISDTTQCLTSNAYGEYEDYLITINTAPPCSNPVAGNATKSTNALCSGSTVDLDLTGNSTGLGQTYQWETTTSLSSSWTPDGAAGNTPTYTSTPSATGTVYYRCGVTCGSTTVYSDTISVTVLTALSGTYTINSATPTGGTNFQSFADAITALNCGLAGPVMFDVAPGSGPYNEQLVLPNTLNTDAFNTLTIHGNGATVQHTPTGTYEGILMMDSVRYVTIDSLTFKSLSTTYGYGAVLYNGCDYDSITRCVFDLTGVNTTASANSMGIRISSTASGTSSTISGATNTYIGDCQVLGYAGGNSGMYYGIYAYGPNTNNIYHHNTISNAYLYSWYSYYGDANTISNNTITRETKTGTGYCYGFYVYYAANGSKVINNRVKYLGGATQNSTYSYPFNIMDASGTASAPILVANNIISNNTASPTYGIRISGGSYIDIYNNTISIDDAVSYTGSNYGIYTTASPANCNIQNNLVSITGGSTGTKYGLYYSSAPATSDYNNVYVNSTQSGTQNFGYSGGAIPDLTTWQSTTSKDILSHDFNPMYTNAATGDFEPTNGMLDNLGIPLPGVIDDINGNPRDPSTPDIGAIEFTVPMCTGTPVAGVATVSDTAACAGGSVDLSLTGFTLGNGITIQWEEALSPGAWTPISGATTANATVPFSMAAQYRAEVRCNGGTPVYSDTLLVSAYPFYYCYCSPNTNNPLHSTTGNYITSVSIPSTPLSVSTSAVGTGGYTFHDPSIASNTATLIEGLTYTLSANITSASYSTEMWIDWDQSGTFDASEYMLLNPGTTATATIAVPLGVTTGMTGLRLRNSTTTAFTSSGACSNISTGRETEDFVINFVANPPCAGTPTAGNATASNDTLCVSGDVFLSLTGYSIAQGLNINWQSSPAGANNFTDILGATMDTFTAAGISAATDYRARVTCTSTGGGTAYSDTLRVEVLNPQIIATIPGSRCNAGEVALYAIGSTGTIVKWYNVPTGGTALDTGNIFITPSITTTTSYYAEPVLNSGSLGASPILITEIDVNTDQLEIQNVSGSPIDVTGWKVILSDNYSNINAVNSIVQTLSGNMNPGDTKAWTDGTASGSISSWGNNILWNPGAAPTYTGWAAILDNNDVLKDVVFMNWSSTDIQTASWTVGSATITPGANWTGNGIDLTSASSGTLSRQGNLDNDDLNDFLVPATGSISTTNTGLVLPFSGFGCEGTRVQVDATINSAASGTGLATGGTVVGNLQADGTTVSYDAPCSDKVVTITDATGGNVLGATSAVVVTSSSVQTYQSAPYVPRVYDISPASDGPATVTIHALQTEFDAYNTWVTTNGSSLPLLPANATDPNSSNIVITQYHGDALDSNTGPAGLYDISNGVTYIPNSSITVTPPSTGSNYWTMQFPVTGFSGFFIHTGNGPLEISLTSIAASNHGNKNRVDWMMAEAKAGTFILERSNNAKTFSSIAEIPVMNNQRSYSYWDNDPFLGINYYRLKMIEPNGSFTYSEVVNATVKSKGAFYVEAYPNPASESVTVKASGVQGANAEIMIMDVTGKLIRKVQMNGSLETINISNLASGVYLIKYTDDLHSETVRVTKE